MHKRQSYRNGVKGTTVLFERKGREEGTRILKEDDPRILMFTECKIPGNKCKGTCVYRG